MQHLDMCSVVKAVQLEEVKLTPFDLLLKNWQI